MPRNYTRKTTWGQTPLTEMESAAAEVMQGKKYPEGEAGNENTYITIYSLTVWMSIQEFNIAQLERASPPEDASASTVWEKSRYRSDITKATDGVSGMWDMWTSHPEPELA
ncbi:unnamed protein product [Pleuronectes platessa]|uniref:Uncharacterized protein n=1 Tax=Pleuronectes platessa TaxID=8262 RepID=A0A9N7UW83_PLEPL|nr:unnamed protein product [Pleuronectes platessa]